MLVRAREVKKGLWELLGLEDAVKKLFTLGTGKKTVAAAKAGKRKLTPAPKLKLKATPKDAEPSPVDRIVQALEAHKSRAQLVKLGKQKDQLLRSLIPLYLVRHDKAADVSSGVVSKFWGLHGVKFAAPNAAKALRNHPGHTKGRFITPKGIEYVEAALR